MHQRIPIDTYQNHNTNILDDYASYVLFGDK